MSDDMFWLEGVFSISDIEKKREMNALILEILKKTGIGRLTQKSIAGTRVNVVAKSKIDRNGIIKFDYSIYEKKHRKGNSYDTNTCQLITLDRGYEHFGLTMNLIMTVLESYSETPLYFMKEDHLGDVEFLAKIIEELTGKSLTFDRRSDAFDTIVYFKQTEKHKNFTYRVDDFPFKYCDKWDQFVFACLVLNYPLEPNEEASRLNCIKQYAYQGLELLRQHREMEKEALKYISYLLDMSLEERKNEKLKKHPLDFISNIAEYVPGPYLVKMYAEAFNIDFWTLWFQIGKKGYWDVTKDEKELSRELFIKPRTHMLYKIYRMTTEDDFIGVWSYDDMILSKTMKDNLDDFKKRFFQIEETFVDSFDTEKELLGCIEDLNSYWNVDKYVDRDLVVEFSAYKNDVRYKKAVAVLKQYINEEIEMFGEFTKMQVREWILRRVNRNGFARKYWHFLDFLSNRDYRRRVLGF